jgi:hypothetical protein
MDEDEDVVKNVPANEVGDRVKVWMGSDPKEIIIEMDANGTYTITVKF